MADPGTAVVMSSQESRSEESLLLDHARRVEESRQGTYAVHVHLSKLRSRFQQPHYIRVATRAFDGVAANFEVVLYVMSNSDLVLICHETPLEEIDEPLYKVRALFSGDPLTMGEEGALDDRFTTWYDLSQPSDYETFAAVAEELAEEAAERLRREATLGEGRQAMSGADLDPSNLAAINRRLQGTDIADLVHDQSAIVVEPGGKGEVLFREHYVSMIDLQRRIAPDVNLFADPWLFQYLTETLDRLMLRLMARLDLSQADESISLNLNLNISTVLSPGFQAFHEKMRGQAQKVVIEMQTIDIFADMEAYASARDWLREHGYRVLVDGLNPLSLQFIDPSLLEADFAKVGWSPEFLGDIPQERMVEMRDVVAHTGKEKLILARVDSEDAVKWGLALGIRRYQGHYADRVVEAMAVKGII